MEGVAGMKSHREGKLTLHSYKVKPAPLPKVDSRLLRDTRKNSGARGQCSRASCGSRKERSRNGSRADPQGAALVLLVRKYPDTLARLDALAAR